MPQRAVSFKGSDNKVAVRREWDLPILTRRVGMLGHPLDYLGLPGAQIEDLRDWQDLLRFRTGIERLRPGRLEREDLEVHRQLLANAAKYKLSGRFELLRGLVEDIILNGTDRDGTRPHRSSGPSALGARFIYNVVNLDFLGGMGNVAAEGVKRVAALKKLLERQQSTDFTLLLTLNIRDQLGEEIAVYIEDAKRRSTSMRMGEMLDWYQAQGAGHKEFRLKAVVPLFIKRFAEHYCFDCYCYPPLVYTGTGKARMVHFVFDLTATPALIHASSHQTEEDVLDLTFFEVRDGILRVHTTQHRHCDRSQSATQLAFLAAEVRDALLGAYTRRHWTNEEPP